MVINVVFIRVLVYTIISAHTKLTHTRVFPLRLYINRFRIINIFPYYKPIQGTTWGQRVLLVGASSHWSELAGYVRHALPVEMKAAVPTQVKGVLKRKRHEGRGRKRGGERGPRGNKCAFSFPSFPFLSLPFHSIPPSDSSSRPSSSPLFFSSPPSFLSLPPRYHRS